MADRHTRKTAADRLSGERLALGYDGRTVAVDPTVAGPPGRWAAADGRAVHDAMLATGVDALAARPVDELSGGQRQRVWIATALAQDCCTT